MRKIYVIVGLFVIGILSGSASAVVIEDFESYSPGAWAGGDATPGNWRATTGNTQIGTSYGLTGQGLGMLDGAGGGGSDTLAWWVQPLSSAGDHYAKFNLKVGSVNGSTIIEMRLRRAGDAAFMGAVKLLATGEVIRVVGNGAGGNTTETLASSFPVGQWLTVEMDIDFANNQYSVSYNGAAWTSYANFGSDITASATADEMLFARGANVSFDDITHDVPEPVTIGLLGLGCAMVLRRRRNNKQ